MYKINGMIVMDDKAWYDDGRRCRALKLRGHTAKVCPMIPIEEGDGGRAVRETMRILEDSK